MRTMNRAWSSLLGILMGCGVSLPFCLLLLIVYGACLTDPFSPDYYVRKIEKMFRFPDPGILTYLGITGAVLGLLVALIGAIRPFIKRSM